MNSHNTTASPARPADRRRPSPARLELQRRRIGGRAFAAATRALAEVAEYHLARAEFRRELAGRGRRPARAEAEAEAGPRFEAAAPPPDEHPNEGAVLNRMRLNALGIVTPELPEPRRGWTEEQRERYRRIDEETDREVARREGR